MGKNLFLLLIALSTLLLSGKCGENITTTDDSIHLISVHVVDQTNSTVLQDALIALRKINLKQYYYLTNTNGDSPLIVIQAGDTLVFSKANWHSYSVVLKKPDYVGELHVYLQPNGTAPAAADTVLGKVIRSDRTMSIVNLADPNRDVTSSDTNGNYKLGFTTSAEWLHVGYANDTTIVVVNAGPGPQTKLDVFFDDSKNNPAILRSN